MAGGKRDFLDTDPTRLDEEWREIPRLVRQYSEDIADGDFELSQAKARADVVEADLSLKIRGAPEQFDLPEKPTEAAIKARIALSPKMQEAQKEINQSKHSLDILKARLAALLEKRRAIEGNVELLKIEYFNGGESRTPTGREIEGRAAKGNREPLPAPRRGR